MKDEPSSLLHSPEIWELCRRNTNTPFESLADMAEGRNGPDFISRFDIPYSGLSALNTLDLHFPANPASNSQHSGVWLM